MSMTVGIQFNADQFISDSLFAAAVKLNSDLLERKDELGDNFQKEIPVLTMQDEVAFLPHGLSVVS